MKYTKETLWLKPFVDEVSDIVPLNKITHIRGYKVRIGCNELAYGSTIYKNGKYTINIKLYDLINKKKYKGSPLSIILDTLAHELSHVATTFDHTPEHFKIQIKILKKFSQILEKNGIMDTSIRYSK